MSMDEEPLTDLTGQEAPGKEEFHICTELSDFPVSDCPAFLREGVGGVCISGHITIQVLDNKFRIAPNMVFTLLPWQLAFIKEVSEDFRMTFFRISQTMFIDTLSGLWRLRPGFFFYMSRHLVSGSDGILEQTFAGKLPQGDGHAISAALLLDSLCGLYQRSHGGSNPVYP